MRLLHPTYTDIHNACIGLAHQIELYDYQLDVIVGVSRGGLVPANHLSQLLQVPLVSITYSSKIGKGDDKNHNNYIPQLTDKSILIVDDICDSGNTLKELSTRYLMKPGNTVYTAAIYYKALKEPIYVPTLSWVTIPEFSDWIHFPWERL